ncbi:MAG: glutamate formimidoyltransferase [Armatimonadetes bacterium]|nr:glutamate formimidoyltransferase [Armatimonadota bacterium]
MEIIECVPNFSEGRRKEVIEALVNKIKKANAKVLDYSMDFDHNRSVITFIGNKESIKKAVLESAGEALKWINMELHKGEHPRIGAVDVIPLIPIKKCTMEDCINLAHDLGREIWRKYNIPVYFYEEASLNPKRKNLALLRKGNYELLKKEITHPERHPDIGEAKLHPTAGAVIIGARKPLIAYNINLKTNNLDIAKDIAKKIREKDGGLPGIKALGIILKGKNLVQVSINLVDYEKTSLIKVFKTVEREAHNLGVEVLESELIGLVPLSALSEIIKHSLKFQDFNISQIIESHLI